MAMPTTTEIKSLLQYLIASNDGERIHQWINLIQPAVDAGLMFTLEDEAAPLNTLVQLRRYSVEKYAEVLAAVDVHRVSMGKEKMDYRSGKAAYVAEYIPVKRAREGRLLNLWNSHLDPSKVLRKEEAKQFKLYHSARWLREKQARQEALRVTSGRRLTRLEQGRINHAVEAEIEDELDELEVYVNCEIRKPFMQRNPNGFQL